MKIERQGNKKIVRDDETGKFMGVVRTVYPDQFHLSDRYAVTLGHTEGLGTFADEHEALVRLAEAFAQRMHEDGRIA